jgi:hypothetical protein
MKLIEYKDNLMKESIYLWISEDGKTLSPYFDTKKKAEKWLDRVMVEIRKKIKKSCTIAANTESEARQLVSENYPDRLIESAMIFKEYDL